MIHIDIDIEGTWNAADATGCSNACGRNLGDSGTAGAVTCSKETGCDASKKPEAKQCPGTPACGMLAFKVYCMLKIENMFRAATYI